MKFGHLFEFHKIPDWYTEYVHYNELKNKITEFKAMKKSGHVRQLKGYYMVNKRGQLYSIDFIKLTHRDSRKGFKHTKSFQKTNRSDSRKGSGTLVGAEEGLFFAVSQDPELLKFKKANSLEELNSADGNEEEKQSSSKF